MRTYTIYAVECQTPNHIYVGMSHRPAVRLHEHARRAGARFTARHGFKSARTLDTASVRDDAIKIETMWANAFADDGWVVGGVPTKRRHV